MEFETLLNRKFTRRTVLGGGLALGSGLLLNILNIRPWKLPDTPFPITDLDQLRGFRVLPPEVGIPIFLAGILPNHPLLWEHVDSEGKVEQELEKASKMQTKMIRVFLDDRIETRLGEYRLDLLDKVARLAEQVDLEVDLHDSYNLLHSDRASLSYDSHQPSSPYLGKDDGRSFAERKKAFFQDPRIIEATQRRFDTFVNYLKHTSGIKAWCVGNEFEAPTEVLNDWYAQMLPVIREADTQRPILSGVADPNLLDEERLTPLGLSANTIHIFAEPQTIVGGSIANMIASLISSNLDRTMYRYWFEHKRVVPLICQEIGYPRLPGNFAYDQLYAGFLNSVLLRFIEINQADGWIRPYVTGLGPWKLAAEAREADGHEITPDELPHTLSRIWAWNEIIEKATAPASNAA